MTNNELTPAELATNSPETISRITGRIPIYSAMWNLPGCLPEMDPFRTLSVSDAREFLADELAAIADGMVQDTGTAKPIAEAEEAAEIIRSGESTACTFRGYVYSIDSGPPIDDEENRRARLAVNLGCALDDVQETNYGENTFDADGGEYRVLTDDEADAACAEDIRELLWAFNASFLVAYVVSGLSSDDLDAIRGDRCEDANQAFVALVEAGAGMDRLIADAIGADGRGHFLAGYDGDELELHDGFYAYRTN